MLQKQIKNGKVYLLLKKKNIKKNLEKILLDPETMISLLKYGYFYIVAVCRGFILNTCHICERSTMIIERRIKNMFVKILNWKNLINWYIFILRFPLRRYN